MSVELIVYTRAWETDRPAENVDDATGHVECRIFVSGQTVSSGLQNGPVSTTGLELTSAISADLHYDNQFAVAALKFSASAVKIVPLTEEQWKALG